MKELNSLLAGLGLDVLPSEKSTPDEDELQAELDKYLKQELSR